MSTSTVNKPFFTIDVNNVFIIFTKYAFLMFFILWMSCYFLAAKLLILLNLLNSYIKRLLSDGFNMADIGNSLMKSHSSQTLDYTLHQILNLCPSKLSFTRPKDGWLAHGLIRTKSDRIWQITEQWRHLFLHPMLPSGWSQKLMRNPLLNIGKSTWY